MLNKKFLILEGGFNEEHQVSLKSSIEIQKVLKQNKIKFITIKVDPKNFKHVIRKYKNYICFNALHGPFGEDGQIQKILKKNKIKFTHSNFTSSKNSFDKLKAKKIILKNNLLTPRFLILNINQLNKNKLYNIKKKFKKFVIKPNNSGSSFGVEIIKNKKELDKFIKNIEIFKKNLFQHSKLLIEEFISGKELTVSTIKFSKKIHSLAVTEIKSKNKFFDYQAKYSKGFSKHILPARISKRNYEKCLKFAEKCHKLLGCNSISRSDFIYNSIKNKIYFIETNTQPGLTPISLLPEQAKYKKISFSKIILNILNYLN